MPDTRFEKLTAFISSYAKAKSLIPLTQDVDKHGSWEWMMHWTHAKLNRYASVYLLESVQVLGADRLYHVEVWAGADDDQRYTRQPVSSFAAAGAELHDQGFFDHLTKDLDIARSKAESFAQFDLRQVYIPSRST